MKKSTWNQGGKLKEKCMMKKFDWWTEESGNFPPVMGAELCPTEWFQTDGICAH